jgi:hypothetical protein
MTTHGLHLQPFERTCICATTPHTAHREVRHQLRDHLQAVRPRREGTDSHPRHATEGLTVFSPHVTAIPHAGASPYAPPLTPSERHAASRCRPLAGPVLPPAVPVDVYPIDMEDATA